MSKLKRDEIKRNTCMGEYQATQKYAQGKRIVFDLTFTDFVALAKQPCSYCGGQTPGYHSNTLSYINWRLGYSKDNVKPCCWPCKRMIGPGQGADRNVEHIQQICEYLQTHMPV